MSRNRSPAVLIFITLFILLPLSAEVAAGETSDVFSGEKCFDTPVREDKYAITRLADDETCMLINDEKDIPEKERGTQSFGEPCDGARKKCKLYVRTSADCLKPTHLLCDPGRRVCACSSSGAVLPSNRFQFGTDDLNGKMNISHGRCLIRPSFEKITGVDCSPGTKLTRVDDDDDYFDVCACVLRSTKSERAGEGVADIDTDDSNWWKCKSKGARLTIRRKLIFFAIMVKSLNEMI